MPQYGLIKCAKKNKSASVGKKKNVDNYQDARYVCGEKNQSLFIKV